MKKLVYALIVLSMALFLGQGVSQATLYSFGDHNYYWGHNQGWAPGQSWTDTYNNNHNSRDVIGTPNLTGGTIETDSNGALAEIKIAYASVSNTLSYHAGDLFLDINGDAVWDYFVDVTDSNGPALYKAPTGNTAASAKKGDNDNYYELSTGVFNSSHQNWYRNDHPVYASASLIAASSFKGYLDDFTDFQPGSTPPTNYVVFDFGSSTITGVDWSKAIIGFAPTCANDVIYEHVPEPATVLIVGFGLLGLGLCSSRKMKKRG